MATLPIVLFGNPILRQRAKKVTNIDRSIQKLIDDMIETLDEASGAGLAAPQVGHSIQVIVIDAPDDDEEHFVLINPEVVKRKGERVVQEGCLSLPGYRGDVKRSETVTVKGRDREGRELRIKAQDLLAQALEHEIDHLNGILYTDYLESMDKLYKVEPKQEPSDEPAEAGEAVEAT